MTSHASSAQPPAIKGGQEGANIISVCVRKTLPAAMQESVEMDKVALVIRDTVGGKASFHTCIIKVVMDFR
jgi:hypothetical protein